MINYGTPATMEELVQEAGRAGRDGSEAEAILYHKIIGRKFTNAMKMYGENQIICRRKFCITVSYLMKKPILTILLRVGVVTFVHHRVIAQFVKN